MEEAKNKTKGERMAQSGGHGSFSEPVQKK